MTSIDISATQRLNDPAVLNITPNSTGDKIHGLNVSTVANIALTLRQAFNRTFRWRLASKDVRTLKALKRAADTSVAPTITSVAPAAGPNDNTTVITITGTHFDATDTVKLVTPAGGVLSAGNVNRVSSTSITFTIPVAAADGTYGVQVIDPVMNVVKATSLVVVASPTITTVAPASVPNDNTTVVTVTGTGFESAAVVTLVPAVGAPIAVTASTRVSQTSITFQVPGTVTPAVYSVKVSDAQAPVTKAACLTVTAA